MNKGIEFKDLEQNIMQAYFNLKSKSPNHGLLELIESTPNKILALDLSFSRIYNNYEGLDRYYTYLKDLTMKILNF